MTRIPALAGALGVVLLLLIVPPAALAGEGALARVRASGTLRWGADVQGGEPYAYQDPQDADRVIGFEVEIADGIARRLGVRAELVQNDWHHLIPALERGDFEMILNGLEVTPARRRRVAFTRPYFAFRETLVVRKGDDTVHGLADLRGERVGTLTGSLAADILARAPGVDTVLYEGVEEPYIDLEEGRIRAVVHDDIIANRYGLVRSDLRSAGSVGQGVYAIAVRPADTALLGAVDAALGAMIADGELRAILTRWKLWNEQQAALAAATTAPKASSASLSESSGLRAMTPAQLLLFLRATWITAVISALAMGIAVAGGLALSLLRRYAGRWAGGLATAYVELFRGTPLLLQLYVLYYGLAPVLPAGRVYRRRRRPGHELRRVRGGAVPRRHGGGSDRADRGGAGPRHVAPPRPAQNRPAAGAARRPARRGQRLHRPAQGLVPGLGDHGGGADQADDDHRGRRARLARTGAPLRRALSLPELSPVAPGSPARTPSGAGAGMSGDLILKVRGLRVRLGGAEILRGIDLAVCRGEVVAVVGPSGGGKTTLLRALNYLAPFTHGEVEIAGHRLRPSMSERSDAGALRAVRTRVGMVFQSFHLFPHLSVLGNVVEAPRRVLGLPPETARRRAEALLAQVGLAAHVEAFPHTLSGGQQQRVAIARALAMEPDVLLLDEPTSALDPRLAREVLAVVADLAAAGQTMLMVTHQLAFARRIAGRMLVLAEGRVVEDGTPSQVLDRPRDASIRALLGLDEPFPT